MKENATADDLNNQYYAHNRCDAVDFLRHPPAKKMKKMGAKRRRIE